MAKKISALLIALLGSVMLLFGCNDPYKNFSISVSKTDVVLYLTDEGEPQEGLINSEYLMATVSGAGKGVSTDVTFAQYGTNGVNDIVSIEDVSKDGNKTLFNLKAQKPGRGIIYVNTQEGNLRAEINVTVYVPVKSIGFVTSNKAVKFGGEVELGKYLTFMPVGTNQTEVSFFIDDSTNAVVTNEQGNVTETSYAKIENGKLISKNASNYPIDDSNGLQYVNVYAVSNYNNQIKTQTVKIYVINVIDMSQVVLSTNSDLNSQPIVLVPSNGNVYDIILGKNSTIPFIFSRNLKIQVGSEFVTDKQYRISTSLDNAKSDVIGLVSLVSENDRYNYNGVADTYPYKTYQINQQVKNMSNSYYNNKAKKMYNLYINNLPCKKVYAAVKKGDKFVVLKDEKNPKWKYQLSGGGVEDGEDNVSAIKREIYEELNMNVKVIKSLGIINYVATWEFEGKKFDVKYEAEIFLTEFVCYLNNNKFGVDGEFDNSAISGIAEISKFEMLENVSEFKKHNILLD